MPPYKDPTAQRAVNAKWARDKRAANAKTRMPRIGRKKTWHILGPKGALCAQPGVTGPPRDWGYFDGWVPLHGVKPPTCEKCIAQAKWMAVPSPKPHG